MADLKWADVAHYYSRSPITLVDDIGDIYDCSIAASLGYLYRWKPILRHLEDMTEAEAREIWQIHFGKPYEKGPFNELKEPCKDEILNSATYGTRNRLNMELMLGNSLTLHWFISRAFDVFDLIESGQAIRKEVANVA